VQVDIAGDEGGDGEDEEDGANPEKSDHERVMAATAADGRGYGFVHGSAHSHHLFRLWT
jgi:hypothetical protein